MGCSDSGGIADCAASVLVPVELLTVLLLSIVEAAAAAVAQGSTAVATRGGSAAAAALALPALHHLTEACVAYEVPTISDKTWERIDCFMDSKQKRNYLELKGRNVLTCSVSSKFSRTRVEDADQPWGRVPGVLPRIQHH